MTKARLDEIAQAIGSDEARAKELFELSPEAAAEKLTKEGFAVAADELIAFGEEAKKVQGGTEGELDESNLEQAAGGLSIPWRLIITPIAPIYPRVW